MSSTGRAGTGAGIDLDSDATPPACSAGFVTLGRYQLLSRLAVGGMAEVYLARQGEISSLKTLVVVKKVLPRLAVKPDFIAMFLEEARIASLLDHPNIVHITEVGCADGEYFIAMELVQGKPLTALLRQGERTRTPLPHALAALITAHAAAGLHYAHQLGDSCGRSLGLVHRDVSPHNLMISFEGSVKLIDFGIARAMGQVGEASHGSLKGKLGYMAPEQARGEAVDLRADIFALGVVLWECLAARRLFLRENELATLRAVTSEPIPAPSRHTAVDPSLEAIAMRALARDPDQRFASAEEMRIALEKWIFASGGTSTHDLSLLMKSWFAREHVEWQRASRFALAMNESDTRIDVAFPNLVSHGSLSRTGTSLPGSYYPRLRRDATASLPGNAPLAPTPRPVAAAGLGPSPYQRLPRLALGLGLALALGGFVAYRATRVTKGDISTYHPPASHGNPATEPLRPTVETLPAPPAAEVPAPNPTRPGLVQPASDHDPPRAGLVAPAGHADTSPASAKPARSSPVRAYRARATRSEERATLKPSQLRPNPF